MFFFAKYDPPNCWFDLNTTHTICKIKTEGLSLYGWSLTRKLEEHRL